MAATAYEATKCPKCEHVFSTTPAPTVHDHRPVTACANGHIVCRACLAKIAAQCPIDGCPQPLFKTLLVNDQFLRLLEENASLQDHLMEVSETLDRESSDESFFAQEDAIVQRKLTKADEDELFETIAAVVGDEEELFDTHRYELDERIDDLAASVFDAHPKYKNVQSAVQFVMKSIEELIYYDDFNCASPPKRSCKGASTKENELHAKIMKFACSAASKLKFPSTLTASDRAYVHMIAADVGLKHESDDASGELTISKRSMSDDDDLLKSVFDAVGTSSGTSMNGESG